MKYPTTTLKAAALVLAATLAPAAIAEGTPTPPVMVDTAPLPPGERSSIGAVVIADSPVLAQREAFVLAAARYEHLTGRDATRRMIARIQELTDPTRAMGAGPARKANDTN